MKPEVLLAQADFVRSLARRLIRDEHLAADLMTLSDEQGCFEARKLVGPSYEVSLCLPGENRFRRWDLLKVEDSPLIEQDIRLPEPVIRGQVLYAKTGEPFRSPNARIVVIRPPLNHAINSPMMGNTPIDGEGRFAASDLGPGRYVLCVLADDSIERPLSEITLDQGKMLENLTLLYPEAGELAITLHDLDPNKMWFFFLNESGLTLKPSGRVASSLFGRRDAKSQGKSATEICPSVPRGCVSIRKGFSPQAASRSPAISPRKSRSIACPMSPRKSA